MGFIDEVRSNAVKFKSRLKDIKTEEATKNALVMPFIKMLGYDIEEPTEVEPEFTADVGVKKGAKVDYALLQDGCPIILIEAKKYGDTLSVGHEAQLLQYFHVTDARFAILTDGITYRFYSDLDSLNKMDDRPFFEFNMLEVPPEQVVQLKRFHKNDFKLKENLEAARELRYTSDIKRVLAEEMEAPSEEFIRFLLNRIEFPGSNTKQFTMQFTPIVKHAFAVFINECLKTSPKSVRDLGNEQPEPSTCQENPHSPEQALGQPILLFLKTKKADAKAQQYENRFIVLAGSKAVENEARKIPPSASQKRKKLIEDGVLKDIGAMYEFTQNQEFNSPSAAAQVICGSSVSGPRDWKDCNGTSLNEL